MPFTQHFLDNNRGLLTAHEDGSMTLGISLDRSRSVTVCHTAGLPLGITPRTTVTIESSEPEMSIRLREIDGEDAFCEGMFFAFSLILCLELLAAWETDDLLDEIENRGEFFPETHLAQQHIAQMRAGLLAVRAQNAARRAG